jgi:hypothetical protein
MIVTFKDLKTGLTGCNKTWDHTLFWWSEGNGGCDCNRAIVMDIDEEMSLGFGEHCCYGSERIVAVDVCGDLEGFTKDFVLTEINSSYEGIPDDK